MSPKIVFEIIFVFFQYLLGPFYEALKMESIEIIEGIQCQTQQENLSGDNDEVSPKRRRLSSSLNSSKRLSRQFEEYDLILFYFRKFINFIYLKKC